ncbi:MAG TPA: transporter [Pyrinomonadaceae bacterium]
MTRAVQRRRRARGLLLRRCAWLAVCVLALSADAPARQAGAFAGNLFAPALRQPRQQATPTPTPPEEDEPEIKPSRPGVANPAEIPEPGVLQLEIGYDSNFRSDEFRSEHSMPVTLRYAAAKRLLLHLDFDAVISQTDEATRERSTGFGDTRVGFQVVALEDAPGRPALAFAYFAKLPTADEAEGLGTGRFDHKVVGLLSKKVGETDVDFNAAYLLVGREGGPGWEHGGQAAVSVSRDFKNRFGFEAELSGQSKDDVQPRGLFALGALRYTANKRLVFDAGARFGLNPEAPRVGLFAGMSVGLTRPSGR